MAFRVRAAGACARGVMPSASAFPRQATVLANFVATNTLRGGPAVGRRGGLRWAATARKKAVKTKEAEEKAQTLGEEVLIALDHEACVEVRSPAELLQKFPKITSKDQRLYFLVAAERNHTTLIDLQGGVQYLQKVLNVVLAVPEVSKTPLFFKINGHDTAMMDTFRELVLDNEEVTKVTADTKESLRILNAFYPAKFQPWEDFYVLHHLMSACHAPNSLTSIAELVRDMGLENELMDASDQLQGKANMAMWLNVVATGYANLLNRLQEFVFSWRAKNWNVWRLYKEVELPLIAVLNRMEDAGLHFSSGKMRELSTAICAERDGLLREIKGTVGDINLKSTKEMKDYFFNKRRVQDGLPAWVKSSMGPNMTSTRKENLETIAKHSHSVEDQKLCKELLEYRKMEKLFGVVSWLPGHAGLDNTLHTTFVPTVVLSGRLSSREPNLQNVPRPDDSNWVRSCVAPRKPGWQYVKADYSQVELRIFADIAGIQTLKEAFANGRDVHTEVAARIFGKSIENVSENDRTRAKMVNFGIIYGMGPNGLASRLNMTLKEATAMYQKYTQETVTGWEDHVARTVWLVDNFGYVITKAGRRCVVRVPGESADHSHRHLRQAVNLPIQGTSADITKWAMVQIEKRFQQEGLQSFMVLSVHDEIIVEAHPDEIDRVSILMKTIMESAAEEFQISVPLSVNVEVHKAWEKGPPSLADKLERGRWLDDGFYDPSWSLVAEATRKRQEARAAQNNK